MTFKKYLIKGIIISSVCILGVCAPIAFPITMVISALTKSTKYLFLPFLILDLKTIITFINSF